MDKKDLQIEILTKTISELVRENSGLRATLILLQAEKRK